MAGLRIEIGVAGAAVDRAVTDAKIGQPVRIVGADRNVAGDVGHHIVDAEIPAQRRLRNKIAEACHRIGPAARMS